MDNIFKKPDWYGEKSYDLQFIRFDGNEDLDVVNYILKEERLWPIDKLSYDLYWNDIRRLKIKKYDDEEEMHLIDKSVDGNKSSILKLFYSVLNNVIYIAKQYQNNGLNINDLISEGNIGAWIAVHKMDKQRFKTSTYSSYWIRGVIREALNKYSNLIRCPSNIVTTYLKLQKFTNLHILHYGEIPNHEQLAKESNTALTITEDCVNIISDHISLDAYKDHFNDEDVFEEAIAKWNDNYYQPDEDLYQESLHIDIEIVLEDLYEREREILKAFFGIGCKEMTLEEIGEKYDLTRERVRQIKDKAVRKLKGYRSKPLKQYLG